MVYLNRIYTKTGDDGQTGLGDGSRVPKTHPRIAAYGTVDELNAVLGMALAQGVPAEIAQHLRSIQNDLFDVGADLCVPEAPDDEHEHDHHDFHAGEMESTEPESTIEPLRVQAEQAERLEHWIDAAVEQLTPLTSFILPGGSLAAAALHVARTVCRRAEIEVLQLAEFDDINQHVNIYLNRLSDLLFVWARLCNDAGRADVLWIPGANRSN
ncbi:MAG: ATP/cobalamin adenosyltransferase [Planctomycetaceae bacterium]|nr:ATP/cobalamin adenosyltransferase [Planctomycetaceae bacterium]